MALAVGPEQPLTLAVPSRSSLPDAFRRALSQSFLAFQPIVSYPDRALYGFEALVRSRDALRSAGELVGAAESLGTLSALGRSVRGAAARALPGVPPDALLFVNLHPHDLLDPDLAADGAPLSHVAGRVVLEITERAAAEQGPELPGRLAALRRLGYRLAVDDLGAGFSSLALLAEIRPEFAKLDMSLVRRVDADQARRRIVRHLFALLGDLGTQSIAEGVETPAERDTLLSLGSPLLQGFLFGAPSPGLLAPTW